MKAETKEKLKAKIKQIGRSVSEWSVPLLVIGTITAAWSGFVQSDRNARDIRELDRRTTRLKSQQNLNAEMLDEAMGKVNSLAEANDKLLEKAIYITETGKEPAA